MWRTLSIGVAGLLTLAACSNGGTTVPGSTTGTAGPPTATVSTAAPSTEATAAPSTGEPTAQGAPVTVDPCTVYPQGEASSLSGITLQGGTAQTYDQGGKGCFYSGGTEGVTAISIARATSAADANAVWDTERQRAQQALQQGLPSGAQLNATLTDVGGVGDRASVASFSGAIGPVTLSGSGIYVLKGATFVAISVVRLNGTAPSPDALKAEAMAVLGRL